MQLTEEQKDKIGIVLVLALFWLVMSYFVSTQPNYIKAEKVAPIEIKREQPKVLEQYGEYFTKKWAR